MSELLAAAAQALGAPEELVMRSAQARAAAQGVSVDEVLAAWAGGAEVTAAAEPAPAPAEPAPEPAPTPSAPPPPPPEPEVSQPAAAASAPPPPPAPAPVPDRVGPSEALEYEQVVTVATAGLKERVGASVPGWLLAVFVALPLFGLLYLIPNSGGVECGAGGVLAADRQTGDVVDCDGSPFTGRGGAGPSVDYLAIGQEVYTECAACHGAAGEGGVGPAMAGGVVLTTFSSCTDHRDWVLLGSQGWAAERGSTYGDTATPVAGGMPGHASLTAEQLDAVVVFERVRLGGADLDATLADCGLGEGAGGGELDEAAATAMLAAGEELYAAAPGACAACHGANGEGGAAPALAGGAVAQTFSSCADHLEWVRLGSQGWTSEVGATYGDGDTPVAGGMPSYTGLTTEQLQQVVLFERVRFGGLDLLAAAGDCMGGGAPEGAPEEAPEGETAPADTETTVPGTETTAAG